MVAIMGLSEETEGGDEGKRMTECEEFQNTLCLCMKMT
jgi:hypothetical protein